VLGLALALASAAFAGEPSTGSGVSTMLDARERALVVRVDPLADLDPAIRTALAARGAESSPSTVIVSSPGAAESFAWGAAALGLGAGIAAMCVLLGCVTLARSHGRLRSV
jgi:hypothetical protein